jgi:4-amino-4-deoxy-L-arabinose transferase-like glycosyltransferase
VLLLIPLAQRKAVRLSYLVFVGLVLGLGLVTKATVYVAIPLALLALLLSARQPVPLAKRALPLFLPALALAVPWYARNIAVYGWPDLLGTINHDAVVVGQLRTADYLSDVGLAAYLKDFLTTTFHSFWGQFGWMAVPMDRRIYLALGLLSALIAVGYLAFVSQSNGWKIRGSAGAGIIVVALWAILTSLVYVYYNLSLVQFQGRYLFPMLIPVGIVAILGLREILSGRWTWIGGSIGGLAVVIVLMSSLLIGNLDKWGLLIAGGVTLMLILRHWLPRGGDGWALSIPLAGMAGLSVYSLFAYIVPYLSP